MTAATRALAALVALLAGLEAAVGAGVATVPAAALWAAVFAVAGSLLVVRGRQW